ncbi:MAG: c-type cytochrome [Formosimonas sp.]
MNIKLILTSTALLGALGMTSLTASANPQIAKANQCFACHSLDKKIIGPSYQDIAKRYKNEPGAPIKIAEHIRNGVVGVWGSTPMPAKPGISDADMNALIKWMLAQ